MSGRFFKGPEELPIGYAVIGGQRIASPAANGTSSITASIGAGALGWRRLIFVVFNESANTLYLCRVGESLNTADEIPPTTDSPAILGPFDVFADVLDGTGYAIRGNVASSACEVTTLASSEGEPEQVIAGA